MVPTVVVWPRLRCSLAAQSASGGGLVLSVTVTGVFHEPESRRALAGRRHGPRFHAPELARATGLPREFPGAAGGAGLLPGRLESGVRRPAGPLQRAAG